MQNSTILYPSPELSQCIKYYWILKTDVADGMTVQTIPSGCMHLVFHRGNRMRFASGGEQPASFLRGQLSLPDKITSPGNIDMIAVIFQPLGFSSFFSLPTKLFYNEYIDVEALENNDLRELNARIANEENTLACIRYIEHFFMGRLKNDNYNSKRMECAMQKIMTNKIVSVDELADSACLGYRQFKRQFEQYAGISPKEYCRIVRFQRALYLLQLNPALEISHLAHACGYYDHPHLVKEFRELSGYAPVQYLSTHVPYSTFFSRDCRLNRIEKNKNS